MILMPIVMVSPLAGLLLFYYLPFETALKIYILILVVAAYCYVVMFKSMRAKAKTGMEAMMGQEALVIEDIDPEGKVLFKNEIWKATVRGKKIPEGKKVRILDVKGLVLRVEELHEEDKSPTPEVT